jgi:hypothetical protein
MSKVYLMLTLFAFFASPAISNAQFVEYDMERGLDHGHHHGKVVFHDVEEFTVGTEAPMEKTYPLLISKKVKALKFTATIEQVKLLNVIIKYADGETSNLYGARAVIKKNGSLTYTFYEHHGVAIVGFYVQAISPGESAGDLKVQYGTLK